MATTSGELTAATIARIEATIAAEIGANVRQVNAAITLLNEGATVPFIARYRKEATGGLDDGQLRTLDERLRAARGTRHSRNHAWRASRRGGRRHSRP